MKDRLEILFWRFARRVVFLGYGYCDERSEVKEFMGESRCAGCDASDVQDWIDNHIKLIRAFL